MQNFKIILIFLVFFTLKCDSKDLKKKFEGLLKNFKPTEIK